jgi:nucleotide-binding universal stress UspA family protein
MNRGDLLFPTDFSPASERAGLVAGEMARQQGVRLHVIHVVPPVTDPEDSLEKLRRLAAELGKDLRVESALLSGRVAHQIIRYARDKRIGCIVLGTHGRTGVSRVLLGSVAESVVRLAPCPVLTVPVSPIGVEEPGAAPTEALALHRCIVCAQESEDLICEACRTGIRG